MRSGEKIDMLLSSIYEARTKYKIKKNLLDHKPIDIRLLKLLQESFIPSQSVNQLTWNWFEFRDLISAVILFGEQ